MVEDLVDHLHRDLLDGGALVVGDGAEPAQAFVDLGGADGVEARLELADRRRRFLLAQTAAERLHLAGDDRFRVRDFRAPQLEIGGSHLLQVVDVVKVGAVDVLD